MLLKHCEELEHKFSALEAEYKNLFAKFLELSLDTRISSETQDLLTYKKTELSKEISKWQTNCQQFKDTLSNYKQDMTYSKLDTVSAIFKETIRSTNKCSKIIYSSAKLFSNNPFFGDFDKRESYLVKKDKTSLSKPIVEQIIQIIKADYMILKSTEKGRSVKGLFYSLNRARKNGIVKIGKTEVNIHLKSSVNLARGKIEIKRDQYEFLKDVLKAKCEKYLSSPSISDELESRLISIKSMVNGKNSFALEQDLLNYFFLVLANFLEENSSLLRVPRVNLFIDLFHSNEYSGFMDETISSFANIFMKVAIDTPLIDAYLLNQKVVKTTEFYDSLIHEFTHSYDWILNARTDYMIARNILGEEPVQSTVILARVIKSLRMEGLAGINSLIKRGIKNNGQILVNINDIFEDFDDYNAEIYLFFSEMYKKDVNWLKKKEQEIYASGSVQYIGFWMALIILIKEFGSNAKYFFTETDKSKALLKSMNENFQHSKLTEKQEGVWLDWNNTGTALVDVAKNPKKRIISMFAKEELLLNFTTVFVKKLGIMSPDLFIEKFVESAKALSIDCGPITPKCIQELNYEKKKNLEKF